LRPSQKLALGLTGVAALLATGIGSIATTHATTSSSTIAALRAKRAALVAELAALQPRLNVAGGAVSAAEAAYNAQQAKVLSEQRQLSQLNAQLLTLDQQLTANQATIAVDKQDLAVILRATWENSGADQVLAAILSANNFAQAVDRLQNATQVSQQVSDLVSHLATADVQIKSEQAQIRSQFAQATTLQNELSGQTGRLLADLMNRNDLYNQLSGPARQIAAEIATIDNEIAADEAPPAYAGTGTSGSSGSCGNHFAYGECTWYVANRRCVPWMGSADQWYYNAAAMGFKEGHQPVPGAIVVFWPGGDGASSEGHVAYVEAVGPADGIPQGEFKLSEMNFYGNGGGWDRVSYRVLPNNSSGIQGFIYWR
jgi:surface antigen